MTTQYICHHGIPRQEWGKRRYQNYDGTLTEEGKLRYRKAGYRSANGGVNPDNLTTSGKLAYTRSRSNYQSMVNRTARKAGRAWENSKDVEGNAKILTAGYADYNKSRARTDTAMDKLKKHTRYILKQHGDNYRYDPEDALRVIRKEGWEDKTFDSLFDEYQSAVKSERGQLKQITDDLLHNMGKTRKDDFAVTSDELSAYDKLTRQLLFKIPEAMKLSFMDMGLAELNYRR